MRHRHSPLFPSALAALILSLLAPLVLAESHIYTLNRHTHSHRGSVDWVDGEGRANLFENGNPRGIDFAYSCSDRFMNSSGYETYLAKWKKPGLSLVLLMHEIGSNSMDTCELKVDVKDFAYVGHNGGLSTETSNRLQGMDGKAPI